jgi:cytochrome c oxidase cbb3-type subunit 3
MSAETPVPERPAEEELPRDGIGEEDNPVPLWFNVGFYGLIVFGILYMVYYTVATDWSQASQYAAEVERSEARLAEVRAELPSTNPYGPDDAEAVAEGKEVFATICVACHQADASGLVGPSLVDPYWKYGSSDQEKFASVHDGRPLGMPPWGAQLGSEKIWKVLAYLETLPKSDEPGVGAPGYEAQAAGAGTGGR